MKCPAPYRPLVQVLSAFQKRHGWLSSEATLFFIAGDWRNELMSWISAEHEGMIWRSEKVSRKGRGPVKWALLDDTITAKAQFLNTLCSDEHRSGAATAKATYCTFADEAGRSTDSNHRSSVACAVALPFTVGEAASFIRREEGRPPAVRPAAAPHSDGECVGQRAAGQWDSCAELLPRHAADLVAVDVGGFPAPSDLSSSSATRSVLDAVTLCTRLLRPSGTMLLRVPVDEAPGGCDPLRALSRHFQWRFQTFSCETAGDHVYCVGCRGAAEDPARGRPVAAFPGLRKKGEWRPRRWSPHGRAERKSSFSAAKPSFMRAPRAAESLRRAVAGEAAAEERTQERADALFGVSVDMVAKGVHGGANRDD